MSITTFRSALTLPTRLIYVERTDDPGLDGKLRAIADRLQGNPFDVMSISAVADACQESGSRRSAQFWRAYAAEIRNPEPTNWPVRICPVCGAEVLPAMRGIPRINCPVCNPFAIRKLANKRGWL